MNPYTLYRPITSTPFMRNADYAEYEPCAALKPYIRCFWGTAAPVIQSAADTIVIPDTCTDIIFRANYTDNTVTSGFCGIDDRTFISQNDPCKKVFTFGIRFYAWRTAAFAEDTLKSTKNAFISADAHFSRLKRKIEPLLFDFSDMQKIIHKAEHILLDSINVKHENGTVAEAVGLMIEKSGNLLIEDLSSDIHISERQLERLFSEYIGCSAKNLASLIRYQCLWNEIEYSPHFDVMDAVLKYGYSDQPHLLSDFKKRHSMNIKQAKIHALKNVGNLQDRLPRI